MIEFANSGVKFNESDFYDVIWNKELVQAGSDVRNNATDGQSGASVIKSKETDGNSGATNMRPTDGNSGASVIEGNDLETGRFGAKNIHE